MQILELTSCSHPGVFVDSHPKFTCQTQSISGSHTWGLWNWKGCERRHRRVDNEGTKYGWEDGKKFTNIGVRRLLDPKPKICKMWKGKGGSAYNGLWAMAISKNKRELKSAQVQAMAQHTLQNTTWGGAGCRTYTISRVLHEEMIKLTRTRWYWRPPNIKQRASQYTFFNFKLCTVTSKQAIINARVFSKGCQKD